jgi:hypothetical protein
VQASNNIHNCCVRLLCTQQLGGEGMAFSLTAGAENWWNDLTTFESHVNLVIPMTLNVFLLQCHKNIICQFHLSDAKNELNSMFNESKYLGN